MGTPHLLLWDIDGTLITSGGAGMRALQAALHEVFAIDGSLAEIDFAGRTDRWIMRQIFTRFGIPATEENFRRLAEGYVALLPAHLGDHGVRLLPGISSLLEAARSRPGCALGLLTGNLRRGAEAKLRSQDLWRYFPFGAFADDSEERDALGPHALRRACDHHGCRFSAADTWVIGDTPHDIRCARAFGARAVAVATGRHSLAELQALAPDLAFATLADPAAFWESLDRT
jgi:phosphoglycolate phosphatase